MTNAGAQRGVKQKVLVTGASGFIGFHCLAPLVGRGYDVIAVHSASRPEPVPGVTWVQANLLDRRVVSDLIAGLAPDKLLHAAWYVEPGKLISSPLNLDWCAATLHLVRDFRDAGGQRCVMVGSAYEYDWSAGTCREDVTPLAPDTLYGAAKNGLREILRGYGLSSGLSIGWGRIFFVYGPRENPRRLVSSVALSLLKGEPALSSHGEQLRDYVHVADVGAGLAALLDCDAQGDFNIASGEAVSIRSIIEQLGVTSGRSHLLRIGALPARANDVPLVVADVEKARREIGWEAKIGLQSGLKQTFDWWAQHMQTAG